MHFVFPSERFQFKSGSFTCNFRMEFKEKAVQVVGTTWENLLKRWSRYGYTEEAFLKRNTKALQHITVSDVSVILCHCIMYGNRI